MVNTLFIRVVKKEPPGSVVLRPGGSIYLFTTPQIGQMAALVDVDKMDHKDAAQKWLKDNEAIWKPWTQTGM